MANSKEEVRALEEKVWDLEVRLEGVNMEIERTKTGMEKMVVERVEEAKRVMRERMEEVMQQMAVKVKEGEKAVKAARKEAKSESRRLQAEIWKVRAAVKWINKQ